MDWFEKELAIKDIADLLDDDYEVEVDSPDGFVAVSLFVDKGMWEEYVLTLSDGRTVRVNENHLFETKNGWRYAKDLIKDEFLTENGFIDGIVTKTGNLIPIVDIQVEHENHRYYTNGVSSHNTGVGKSMMMCHMAAANLSIGKNVLYITMEMAEERIAERIEANLLNVTIDELRFITLDNYKAKFEKLRARTNGKLIIKEYPTGCAGAANFRHLLNELKIKKNFKPDIIYVDYLNICMSSRLRYGANVKSYEYVKSIAEEMRGLAVEHDVPIVSATQVNRTGYTSSDFGLEDTSESFGLPFTADLMIALISTEELEGLHQIMVKQLKNRYSSPDIFRRFVIGIDKDHMRFYDVEDSAQDIHDGPVMDNTKFGEEDRERSKPAKKFGKDRFQNFK